MKNLGYGLTYEHLKKTYAELTQNFRSMQYPQFWIRKLPITPADFPRNFAPQITRYNIRTSADPHIRILPPAYTRSDCRTCSCANQTFDFRTWTPDSLIYCSHQMVIHNATKLVPLTRKTKLTLTVTVSLTLTQTPTINIILYVQNRNIYVHFVDTH